MAPAEGDRVDSIASVLTAINVNAVKGGISDQITDLADRHPGFRHRPCDLMTLLALA